MTSVIQYYGTGRRKCASARIRLVPGTGQVAVNGRALSDYIGGRSGFDKKVLVPFQAADAMGRFDVIVSVRGGGISGQVDAIRHGISRALAEASPKPIILFILGEGTKRYGEVQRRLPDITKKMLTQTLRALEDGGLVTRRVYAEVPPKVEYTLTPLGRVFLEPVTGLCRWASKHPDALNSFEKSDYRAPRSSSSQRAS